MKHPWLRIIGFMLLFYLIIRGVLYLMVSNVGGDNRSSGRQSTVYIINPDDNGKRFVDELFVLLENQPAFKVQIIDPEVFMNLPLSPDAKVVVPPAGDQYFWNYIGDPVITRLFNWVDTGSLVLTFNMVPKRPVSSKDIPLINQGYYLVKFPGQTDSTVLWINETGIDSAGIGEEINATVKVKNRDLPVIGTTRKGRGKLITCLARPQVTAGAESLVNILLNIKDSVPLPLMNKSEILPIVFDSLLISRVNGQLQTLLTGSPSSQVAAINWLAEYRYPVARYAIVPLLFSNDQKVVFAAAEALVQLRAFNALEPLKIAIQLQKAELKPLLRKAEQTLTSYAQGRDEQVR